jgi:hypothetical protein
MFSSTLSTFSSIANRSLAIEACRPMLKQG